MTQSFVGDNSAAIVKEKSDLVQIIGECVELKKSGARFMGLCPFHGEKTPSFTVHPGSQFFHCFGCGESGDVFSFMMKYYNQDFPEALKNLAQRYDVPLKTSRYEQKQSNLRKKILEVNLVATDYFSHNLKKNKKARDYIESRFSQDAINKWELGFAEDDFYGLINYMSQRGFDATILFEASLVNLTEKKKAYDFFRNRIIFPIFDESGKVVAFNGRSIDNSMPKYINSKEHILYKKSEILYGLSHNRANIRELERADIVEGPSDVITLWDNGIKNAVAPSGTALTLDHIKSLNGLVKEISLCFDGDSAGVKAILRVAPEIVKVGLPLTVIELPNNQDPDEIIKEQGIGKFKELEENRVSFAKFMMNQLHLSKYDDPDKIFITARNDLYPNIDSHQSPLQKYLWLDSIAKEIGVSRDIMIADYNSYINEKNAAKESGELSFNPEDYYLALLSTSPNYRKGATKEYWRDNFDNFTNGLFFEWICRDDKSSKIALNPKDVMVTYPLFANLSRGNLMQRFISHIEELGVIIPDNEIGRLEGVLSNCVIKDKEYNVIKHMRQKVLGSRLTQLDIEIKNLEVYEDKHELLGMHSQIYKDYKSLIG